MDDAKQEAERTSKLEVSQPREHPSAPAHSAPSPTHSSVGSLIQHCQQDLVRIQGRGEHLSTPARGSARKGRSVEAGGGNAHEAPAQHPLAPPPRPRAPHARGCGQRGSVHRWCEIVRLPLTSGCGATSNNLVFQRPKGPARGLKCCSQSHGYFSFSKIRKYSFW